MPHTEHVLIGSAETAELFGVSRATVNRWALSGLLPVAMSASGRRPNIFHRADVIAFGKARNAEFAAAAAARNALMAQAEAVA